MSHMNIWSPPRYQQRQNHLRATLPSPNGYYRATILNIYNVLFNHVIENIKSHMGIKQLPDD